MASQFPIQFARTLPTANIAQSYIQPETEEIQALSGLGEAVFGLGLKEQKKQQIQREKEYELKQFTEIENGKIAIDDFDSQTRIMLQGINNTDEITKIAEKRLQERQNIWKSIATLPESQQALDIYSREKGIRHAESLENLRFEKQQDNALIAFNTQYNEAARLGKFDLMPSITTNAYNKGIISPEEYNSRIENIPEMQHTWMVDQIREASQNAAGFGNKEAGYKIINDAQSKGLITAEDNKILGDSLDNFVAGRFAKEQKQKYTLSVESYRDLISKFQNKELDYKDLDDSNLSEKDVEDWGEYIKHQFDRSPVESSYNGFNKSSDIVFDVYEKQMNEKEAYRQLIQLKIDKKISDTQFNWAIDKIQNPFPPGVSEDMRIVFEDTKKAYKGIIGFNKREQAATQAANKGLMNWVESRIKEGKPPSEKEMYSKARWFKSEFKSKYELGDYEVRGGITYIVVDYDEDGQPLFDIEGL